MPSIVYEILDVFASIIRFIGLGLFGVGIGWLAVDLLKKATDWPLQAVVFTVLAGLMIAMVNFLSWGALGAFGIGVGIAILVWGIPRKKKEEVEE
jgi:hypothetical protein